MESGRLSTMDSRERGGAIVKLSEAITEGIKAYPEKAIGQFYEGDNKACAIGCAKYAVAPFSILPASHYFPQLNEVRKWHETTDTLRLGDAITHFNDDLDWSREEIADWLEGLGY